jgi:hypothetical protein
MVGLDLNYQLGTLAGSIIYEKYLPTLSTDMMQSNVVIQVTDEAYLSEHNRFNHLFDSVLGNEDEFKKIHKEWLEFYKPMSRKYLPETIKCKIEKIKPTNIEQFKKGLNDYLWNTDLSHYLAEEGFFLPNVKYAWCSTIILTRTDR